MTGSEPVTSAVELLSITELVGVKTYELRSLLVGGRDGEREATGPEEGAASDLGPEVMVRYEGKMIEARLRLEHRTEEAILTADIAVIYEMREARKITNAALGEFLEKVGVMAVFPFIREAIVTSAARLGVAVPVLGMLRAGGFSVGLPAETQDPARLGVKQGE